MRDGGARVVELCDRFGPETYVSVLDALLQRNAPTGTFLHSLVTGIDPAAPTLGDSGAQHTNGFGEQGYGGPQPPVGDDAHRYVFRLYAWPSPSPPRISATPTASGPGSTSTPSPPAR